MLDRDLDLETRIRSAADALWNARATLQPYLPCADGWSQQI